MIDLAFGIFLIWFWWFLQTDLEEAKSQEISKLEAAITELQAQNTNALSAKEIIISRQVPTIKETEVKKMIEVSSSKVEKLQAENEHLMVIPYFRNPVVLTFLVFANRGSSNVKFSLSFCFP